jgi:hypothetical protein
MKQTVLTKNRLHVSNSHILILLLQYFLLSTFVYEIADYVCCIQEPTSLSSEGAYQGTLQSQTKLKEFIIFSKHSL